MIPSLHWDLYSQAHELIVRARCHDPQPGVGGDCANFDDALMGASRLWRRRPCFFFFRWLSGAAVQNFRGRR